MNVRNRAVLPVLAALCLIASLASAPARAEETSEDSPRLKRLLSLFPRADADRNGVLTQAEWAAFSKRKAEDPAPAPRPGPRANPRDRSAASRPDPTFADVPHGPHPRNVLDFWKAAAEAPAPLIVVIHGGGFRSGDKSAVRPEHLRAALGAGVSYASINYRLLDSAPIHEILRDAARAVQFLRSKAAEWNLDKARFAAHGGSAGA
ncbi:MAG: alpha/beta hydrolase, partial [Planctomycetes bacterium]|nr:alpha/beta hydrolase [Planctomycetota bacterium]